MADYAEGGKGDKKDEDEFPLQEFEELVFLLEAGIAEAKAYCKSLGADIDAILDLGEKSFSEVEVFRDYANLILQKDEYKKQLSLYVNTIVSLYDSSKPDIYDYPCYQKDKEVFEYLRKVVERLTDKDEAIERAKKKIDELLDTSVVSMGDLKESKTKYIIDTSKQIDLSKLDFDKLRAEFPARKHKQIAFADLLQVLEIKLKQMLAANKTRGGFLERFEKIIEDYNTGSKTLEEQYEQLINLLKDSSKEEQRAAKNDMTDQELELFDLLKKEKLTKKEAKEVKLAAKTLLQKLFDAKNKILIQEWHKEKATQEMVRREIQKCLENICLTLVMVVNYLLRS